MACVTGCPSLSLYCLPYSERRGPHQPQAYRAGMLSVCRPRSSGCLFIVWYTLKTCINSAGALAHCKTNEFDSWVLFLFFFKFSLLLLYVYMYVTYMSRSIYPKRLLPKNCQEVTLHHISLTFYIVSWQFLFLFLLSKFIFLWIKLIFSWRQNVRHKIDISE